MLGIDEAGRGPVLGPLVYGCAYCAVDDLEMVKSLGVAGRQKNLIPDSKTLKEVQREHIYRLIQQNPVGWMVNITSAESLSRDMCKM